MKGFKVFVHCNGFRLWICVKDFSDSNAQRIYLKSVVERCTGKLNRFKGVHFPHSLFFLTILFYLFIISYKLCNSVFICFFWEYYEPVESQS